MLATPSPRDSRSHLLWIVGAALSLPVVALARSDWVTCLAMVFIALGRPLYAASQQTPTSGLPTRLRLSAMTTALAAPALVALILFLKDWLPGPAELSAPRNWIDQLPGALPVAASRNPATFEAARFAAIVGAIGFAIAMARRVFASAETLRLWVMLTVALGGITAIWLLTSPAPLGSFGDRYGLGELRNGNAVGGLMAAIALLALGWLVSAGTRQARFELIGALVLFSATAAVVIGMASRGASVAFVGGLAFFVWQWRTGAHRRTTVGVLVFLLLVVLGALLVVPEALAELFRDGLGLRWELWKGSLVAWRLAPIGGAGLGTFESTFALHGGLIPPVGARFTHPDSSWVLLLLEWGTVGILAGGLGLTAILSGAGRSAAKLPDSDDSVWRQAAMAALLGWTVAAVGDISLHRPAWLVITIPLLGMAFPVTNGCGNHRRHRWQVSAVAIFWALATVPWASLRPTATELVYETGGGEIQLSAAAATALHRQPNNAGLHHRLGRSAALAGDFDLAAAHWGFAGALEPGNLASATAYAHALQRNAPALSLPFWTRAFQSAGTEAFAALRTAMDAFPATPAFFWQQACADRIALFAVLAGDPATADPSYHDRWLRSSAASTVPVDVAAAAFARWGTLADFEGWLNALATIPKYPALRAAELLLRRNRPEFAWTVARRLVPRPPDLLETAAAERTLRPELSVRIDPDDFVALGRLLSRLDPNDPAYETRLLAATQRPGAPAWFAMRLAHAQAERGDYAAAAATVLPVIQARR